MIGTTRCLRKYCYSQDISIIEDPVEGMLATVVNDKKYEVDKSEHSLRENEMNERSSDLHEFLEMLQTENFIKIYDDTDQLLFSGKAGDVPLRITGMKNIVKGTVINRGDYLSIVVKTCQ